MNKLILIILSITFSSFIRQSKCEMITNGSYKIEYDEQFKNYPKIEFQLANDLVEWKQDNTIEKLQILPISSCTFRLKDLKVENVKPTEFQKQINTLGEPYFEITKIEKDIYHFVYRQNLHIQIYSGRFVKVK